ncbi:SDR family oxidoreductase [Streptomyces sp. NBC_01363]|uniref:SDR family oxidoreductase n=1 Tax=Streptomyces sp. NBC_01363 TaxID=2903840 RepID=UPI002253DF54|nr:SDR family oxidoreductase [Streptomyces sp. NBC_01363]MCX4734063.1 SDR family oxidoreductase [Streptomyces sp. NBC_01363]
MLTGRNAVVTGGSRGIGRAIVERLCRDGAHVVFNYATSDDAAAEVVRTVRGNGGRVRAVRLDLVAVNTRAVFTTIRHAALRMRDGGRIVNISTANTVRPGPGISAYVASKGAVEQLTVVAAHELGARGITVNTVSPGATDTELLRGTNQPQALEAVTGMIPLRRLGEPADVADAVAFLAGHDGRWITGQNIRATGGLA